MTRRGQEEEKEEEEEEIGYDKNDLNFFSKAN